MRRTSSVLAVLALAAVPYGGAAPVAAQDIEMLGERYGTPVPDGYRRTRQADPTAFTFERGLLGGRALRGDDGLELRSFEGGSGGGPMRSLGPRDPVLGTYRIPVVLGMYGNSGQPPPFDRATIQDAYFGAGPGTITDYYDEVSNSRVTLEGDVLDWVQTARPDTAYTVGESGLVGGPLGGGGAGNFVYELLDLQSGIDWGLYDNDGPDGVPNSGDDDGFVDVLAVVHPTRGAECGGSGNEDRMWSHRWSLSAAVGTVFQTSTPRAGGGFIRVNDYTIQPSIACSGGNLNEIGVFTHELGHAFGLPDLYDSCDNQPWCPGDGARTSGAGIWDLMASGSWGCNNASPSSPCHMGAWTKAALGWVDVVTLGPDTDHGTITVPPVIPTATVYRIDANDGSGEYFLLENRQRVGFDQNLYHEGLLIWQIDPDWVSARWSSNIVNANAHQGVWLRQADGLDELGNGQGRGDASDPFPGATGNTAFHTATVPASLSWGNGVTGVTIFDIQEVGDDVSMYVSTRFSTLSVDTQGATSGNGIFTVNGQQVDPPATTFVSAPFVEHEVEAAAGEAVAPGERRPFVDWLDDGAAPRVRTIQTPLVDTTFVARYGGTEYELSLTTSGGVNAVEPGSFSSTPTSPDFWYPENTNVTLTAQPLTGYAFLGWTGAFAGQGNPASFTMTSPLAAGADFELVYRIPPTQVELPAATRIEVQLEVENGTAPVNWTIVSGALPVGLSLARTGRLFGSALDLGRFDVTLQAIDGNGLPDTATIALELVAPVIPIERLTSVFLLSGPPLSDDEINFLNRQGNRVAPYDVGDLRAWLLANPQLPLSADFGDGVYRRTIVIGRGADAPDRAASGGVSQRPTPKREDGP